MCVYDICLCIVQVPGKWLSCNSKSIFECKIYTFVQKKNRFEAMKVPLKA